MSFETAPEVDGVLTDLFDDGQRDPYPHYGRLHRLGAAHRSALVGWVVTGHEACNDLLRSGRVIKGYDREWAERPDPARHVSIELIYRTLLMRDPPHHTRLRALVNRAFTPRTVAGLRPAIETLLHDLLAPMAERAADGVEVDLMESLAFPFPIAVIGQLIGVPRAEQQQFRALVLELTRAVELVVTEPDLARADAAATTIIDYFEHLIGERTRRPADDLTSALIAVRDAGDRLTADDLLAMLVVLFIAGFETTTNLIGNGMLALLDHREQLARLRADPAAMPAAVEELLRYDTPVQFVGRLTAEPVTLPDGTHIRADRRLLLILGAANRDPRAFTDPDTLRLDRAEAPVLSFGGGIHFCLGAGLARLEAGLVFTELLRRWPVIDPAGEPARRAGLSLRGLTSLPLRLRTAGTPAVVV